MYAKKGQVSNEFLFAIGIVFLIFLILFVLSFEKTKEVRDIDRFLEKKSECLRIAQVISGAQNLGEGIEIHITTQFNVKIKASSFIEVQRTAPTEIENPVECKFLGKAQQGTFTGDIIIRNIDNEIVIT